MKTVDFLDAIKARYDLPSDYAAAPMLGLTRSQVSYYRNGKSFMGDECALRAAELLGLPPEYVLACVHAERATDSAVASTWARMANAMRKAGAATATGLLLSALLTTSPDALASQAKGKSGVHCVALYIMSTRFTRLKRVLHRLFFGTLPPPQAAHA